MTKQSLLAFGCIWNLSRRRVALQWLLAQWRTLCAILTLGLQRDSHLSHEFGLLEFGTSRRPYVIVYNSKRSRSFSWAGCGPWCARCTRAQPSSLMESDKPRAYPVWDLTNLMINPCDHDRDSLTCHARLITLFSVILKIGLLYSEYVLFLIFS